MDLVNSILLGLIQGITEFIPISSSGHLILVRELLGIQISSGLAFDAVLQLATTFAVFVYFRKDILKYIKNFFVLFNFSNPKRREIPRNEKTLLYAVIIGTIPAIILGLLLEEKMETIFRDTNLVALSLIIGGLVMLFAEKFSSKYEFKNTDLTPKRGLIVGLFQSLALIPGFSRSGMTISGGLFAGLNRELAARFSFLLAFPILLGSGLKKILDLFSLGLLDDLGTSLIVGSIVAFLIGLGAIHFLISFLKNNKLYVFVWYRFILAAIVLIFL